MIKQVVKRKKVSNKKRQNKVNSLYGTANRPPQFALRNNAVIMRPPKNSTFAREFKLQIPLSTTGAQVFDNICISMYHPMQYTRVAAGTVTVTQAVSTGLTDSAAIFREFRPKKIMIQYTNTLGTSTAFPPIYLAMDAESSATNIGNAAASAVVNRYQNSVQLDAHISTSGGYWVPHAASLANQVDNVIEKGWLSTDLIGTGLVAGDIGIIVITYGDATVLGAPLTTTAGILDIIYWLEFKLPEL